jgi:hypothetical protein
MSLLYRSNNAVLLATAVSGELESRALNDGIRGSVPGDIHRDGLFVTAM